MNDDRHQRRVAGPATLAVRELRTLQLGERIVSSASGLAVVGGCAHVVLDDELVLATFPLEHDAPGRSVPLFAGELPRDAARRKQLKPDLEALAVVPGDAGAEPLLLGLGSGSTAARCRGFTAPLRRDGSLAAAPRTVDLRQLYADVAARLPGDLNVEGAAVLDERLLLACRSSLGDNRLATIDLAAARAGIAAGLIDGSGLGAVVECPLGELQGVPLGLTDIAPLDGLLVFVGAAEATSNAYDDGAVTGSGVGLLTPHDEVVSVAVLEAPGAKIEGVAVAERTPTTITLWLVTDADDPRQPSRLLECVLPSPVERLRALR